MGFIVFYEGNRGSQNIVETRTDEPGQNFRPRQNDETRSVKLINVRVGTVITVFDSPEGSLNDDFTVIEVLRTDPEYTVDTFERSYDDGHVRVSHIHNNGLDGKVSRIHID